MKRYLYQSKNMDPSLPPGINLYFLTGPRSNEAKRDMPQSTHSKKVGASSEFWETLTCPRLGRPLPEFTGCLESSAHISLKLSSRTGPSFPSLLPHA